MGRAPLSVASCLLVVCTLLVACSKDETPEKPVKSETVEQSDDRSVIEDGEEPALNSEEDGESEDSDEPETVSIFTNSEGQILCPVWQIIIESADVAEGSTTLDGVTYYFCDKEAEKMFKADPARFID